MKVTFRTLNGKAFNFDANPDDFISKADLSSFLPQISSSSHPQFIFKGNMIKPNTTFSSLNFKKDDFIVVYTPQKYVKQPHQPMNHSSNIFECGHETNIFPKANQPSVQPLPDISRPTSRVTDFIDPSDQIIIESKSFQPFLDALRGNEETQEQNDQNNETLDDELYVIPGTENLTEEDRQAIVRLHDLTKIDIETIIQVYVACGKDENIAANCLLSIPE